MFLSTRSLLSAYKHQSLQLLNFSHIKNKNENLDLMSPSSQSPTSVPIYKQTSFSHYSSSNSPPPTLSWLNSLQWSVWPPHHPSPKQCLSRSPMTSILLQSMVNFQSFSYPHYEPHLVQLNTLLETLFILDSQDTRCSWFSYLPDHSYSVFFGPMRFIIKSRVSQGSVVSWLLLCSRTPSLCGLIWAHDFECHLCTNDSQTRPALAWMAKLRNTQLFNRVCNIVPWILS